MEQKKIKQELKAWSAVFAACIAISIIMGIIFPGISFLQSLRAILGLIYVLFVPGYVMVRLFFNEVDWIEKAALSMGLSISLVILSVMFSNLIFRIPITPITNFLVILAVIIIIFAVKYYQKQINGFFDRLKGKYRMFRLSRP